MRHRLVSTEIECLVECPDITDVLRPKTTNEFHGVPGHSVIENRNIDKSENQKLHEIKNCKNKRVENSKNGKILESKIEDLIIT